MIDPGWLNQRNASLMIKSRFLQSYFISITSENLQAKLSINRFYRNFGLLMAVLLVGSICNFMCQIYDTESSSGRFRTPNSCLFFFKMTLVISLDFSFKTYISQVWISFRILFADDICSWNSIQSNLYEKIF